LTTHLDDNPLRLGFGRFNPTPKNSAFTIAEPLAALLQGFFIGSVQEAKVSCELCLLPLLSYIHQTRKVTEFEPENT